MQRRQRNPWRFLVYAALAVVLPLVALAYAHWI